jgi:hypothetical protein
VARTDAGPEPRRLDFSSRADDGAGETAVHGAFGIVQVRNGNDERKGDPGRRRRAGHSVSPGWDKPFSRFRMRGRAGDRLPIPRAVRAARS